MYALYKQLHPPTGIELCTYCHFFNLAESNLVTVAVNQIHVYRLNVDYEPINKAQEKTGGASSSAKQKRCKFECLATYSLFGNVASMQSVRLAGASRDALFLSFREAKLSMVEYDPATHDLKTTSLHYFEEEDLKDGSMQHSHHPPSIRVDPEGRCAAMLIYGRRLVVLPLTRDGSASSTLAAMSGEIGGGEGTFTVGTRSPILKSYVIDLFNMDERIINVVDFQFLHGYYEPTVLLLFEPLPTWAARVAVRKDSCSIVAISLNLQEKVHPIIWSMANLPFDCFSAIPIQKSIGGVLIVAANSLIYLNQSFPPCGVSLNSLTDFATDFPLKPQPGVTISLDCSVSCFISHNRLVMSLKGGEIYVVTLLTDGLRAVQGFHMDKAAASVLTSCMCLCDDGYLFLGSRLGNSLLLRFSEKLAASDVVPLMALSSASVAALELPSADAQQNEAPSSKKGKADAVSERKKTDLVGDWIASDVSQLDDLDDLEVYGTSGQQQTNSKIAQYVFEVCDSIMNIGPCSQITMGEPAFLSEEYTNTTDPDIELVTTSGFGKNGAISVLQRSVKPQVVTTFELVGCTDVWTVAGQPRSSGEKRRSREEESDHETDVSNEDNTHAFLILSRDDSSMVLQTGQEIMEIDNSGFCTQVSTIFAGNIGNNRYVLQVTTIGVHLLDGANQIQFVPIDVGAPIVTCSVADPYVVLLSQHGHVLLLTLKIIDVQQNGRLSLSRPQVHQSPRPVAINAYKDLSRLFVTTTKKQATPTSAFGREGSTSANVTLDNSGMRSSLGDTSLNTSVIDEDELLYGETSMTSSSMSTAVKESQSNVLPAPKPNYMSTTAECEDTQPTYWCAFARENGMFEICSLPDFKSVFTVKNFTIGQTVLTDSGAFVEQVAGPKASSVASASDKGPVSHHESSALITYELMLVGLGHKGFRPHLIARVEEELLIYEVFPFYSPLPLASSTSGGVQSNARLQMRFRKVQHDLILKERKMTQKGARGRKGEEQQDDRMLILTRWLHPFDDISGYSGVFISGPYPHWLICSSRGAIRIHPMGVDGSVTSFSPFNNVNCPKGFLYFNRKSEMRICVLPTHLNYDASWPVRKVPLRCTPYYVIYHTESKTYSVVTSTSEQCRKVVRIVGDGEKEFETCERDERFVYSTLEKFSIQLFSPVSWEPIPNTKLDMEEFEHVTCVKNVTLKSEGTLSGLKGFVAVATNYIYNEDVTSRGRILIYDVIDVVPEPGLPLTKNKMKIEYDKEQKGPVTALECVDGFLVNAIGQKIYIFQLKDQDLRPIAFIDTQIYIHTMACMKNLILIGDIYKSISLLRYQEDMRVLSLVSRDVKPLEVYGVGYVVNNTSLSFIVTDRMKNIIIYAYQPEVRESHGGQRLLRRADFHVGSHINTIFRIRCKLSDPSTEKKMSSSMAKRHTNYFATLDGSLSYLLPLSEKTYRRLLMVQNALLTHMSHAGSLNPKAYRTLQSEAKSLGNFQRNILDGDLIWKYLFLSISERNEVAKRIGTTCEQITDDIMEIDRSTAHF